MSKFYHIFISRKSGSPESSYEFYFECRDKWVAKRKALSECRRMEKVICEPFTYFITDL